MKKNSKGIILLLPLLVVALFLIVGVGYYAYKNGQLSLIPRSAPSPTQTTSQASNTDLADWKTYRNEEFGFEIKYPAEIYEPLLDTEINYPFRKREIPQIAILSFYAIEGEGWSAANISILSGTEEQYINSSREFNTGSYELIEQETLLNGVKAKKVFYKSLYKNEIKSLRILIEHNSYLYVLDRDVGDEEWEIHADQILSTFKFLD